MAPFAWDAQYATSTAITGIDEVGRGCLAGPVVVAAVTWHPATCARESWFTSLADSKQIDEARRIALYPAILAAASRIRVTVISHILVDYLNILRATLLGFELVAPAVDEAVPLLIDGNQRPVSLPYARTVIKGDSRVSAIAAAAIVAKVTRDELMKEVDRDWPQYGFAQHKGYATAVHRRAIANCGASVYHRKSFRPVRDLLPAATRDDQTMLRLVRTADDLPALWGAFLAHYPQYSHRGAQQIVQAFGEQGLALLPPAQVSA